MTLKEFYELQPANTRDNLFYNINSEVLGGVWTNTVISQAEKVNMSINTYIDMFDMELSPNIEKYLSLKGWTPADLNSANFKTFCSYVFYKYKEKWLKLFTNVYNVTYNPIWNVEGSDSTVRTFEHGKVQTETRNMTDTYNKGSTETTTITSDITQNSRNGFNSAAAVDTDKSSRTGSSNVAGSGYDSDVRTGTDTFTNSGVDTERTTLTRGMNIGVQSTQNLLTMEIDLREKFNYFKMIQEDIINEMALNIYIN